MSKSLCMTAVAVCLAVAGAAVARPTVDGANVHLRIFNDAPGSNATSVNNYPTLISVSDTNVSQGNFANRHNFRLSSGGTDAAFANSDSFSYAADVTITGTAAIEGGLNISPWWSQQVDGNFMLNADSGEIAVFGGRLPFYSFTGHEGVTYVRGQTARLGVSYDARGNNAGAPGAIRYFLSINGNDYSSPWILFDQGNPAEDPPHGLYGLLNDYMVGGYMQIRIANGNPDNGGTVTWGNVSYVPTPGAAGVLALGGLVALRRRR
jgi:hypothetical protein